MCHHDCYTTQVHHVVPPPLACHPPPVIIVHSNLEERRGVTSSDNHHWLSRASCSAVFEAITLGQAKRALQTRLRLAGFKASHGWQDVSFEKIEPQLLGTLKQRQAESSPTRTRRQSNRSSQRSELCPESYAGSDRSQPAWTTPDHRLPSYHSESESTHTFSLRTTPQMNSGTFNAPSSSQPRSQVQPPSYPHTPEQIIRSKWTMARIPSQTHSNTTPEDDELRDQTTAAEMMLFLATGSPSPDHRSISAVTQHRCHHAQLQPQFRT
ncbi:hypothetical protein MJO28_000131 [Puccinia striiformis f. sp. tritici]|uniref:Uncharacterized protein n=1 Tax=Puccinia striiformis f. sp. tritici TaxID=168172 RepID=A0ACC0EXE0_9BASI|nr:hypothetical protein Pst134EA_001080 [Puccinia striiformis f. sp. tritici]KAH9474027.1 hypothetical protein Pst134EA_001080 [Puccinia striiformis f. sp. tritici]KAI7962037.1 hypothetical protein MJO28_000131 [Puccinia striiformis f. sp. tritici]